MPSRCSELSVARSAVRGRRARGAFPYCGAGMDALEMVADWPVERAAVGVMAIDRTAPNGGTWAVVGIIGPHSERFRWASVTKPATALAVLVASEEGTLSLDDPAGPPGSTVRHLLAHASGLGLDPGPPVAPPGAGRIYSNAGYLVLADLLEERSGIAFGDYLSLLVLGRELAAPALISAETHRQATSVQFPGLGGVLPGFQQFDDDDWGLGVEIRGRKHPHWTGTTNAPETFGHFGRTGSFLWVDPVAGVLCGGLTDRPFGLWSARACPRLADAVLAEVSRGTSR